VEKSKTHCHFCRETLRTMKRRGMHFGPQMEQLLEFLEKSGI